MGTRARTVNDYPTTRALRKALTAVEEEDDTNKLDESALSASRRRNAEFNSSTSVTDATLDESWDWVLTNYDVGTTLPQSISQELHRLQVLKSYLILDQDREDAFERLTNMAARVFNTPIALISLVDMGRQWFLSNHGLGDVRETPRNLAFCAHAIQGRNELFIVRDTLEDPRFCNSPLVQGAPFIRFYAGAPLLSPEGYKLGTFCVIDSKPRPDGLSENDQENLKDFGQMAMKAMVDRRQITSQEDTAHLVACTAHDLLTPLMGVQLSLSLLEEEASASLSEAHQECLYNAIRSSDWLHRICQTTIETLREDEANKRKTDQDDCACETIHEEDCDIRPRISNASTTTAGAESPFIDMKDFMSGLNLAMESIPKRVPLILTVDDSVPAKIVSDDLKLFRSSLNLLTNAFAHTAKGSVHFHVHASSTKSPPPVAGRRGSVDLSQLVSQPKHLVFECTDTGREFQEVDAEALFKPSTKALGIVKDLGLYSVAYQIESLGGSYGYRSRRLTEQKDGSVFWFQIPIVLPEEVSGAASVMAASMANESSLHNASCASLGLMDISDSNHNNNNNTCNGSLRTLDSSVVHFPAVIPPSPATTPKLHRHARSHHHHHRHRHPSNNNNNPLHHSNANNALSLSLHGPGSNHETRRRISVANPEAADHQHEVMVNRSGILAVAAASMPRASKSVCELDKMARFGGTLEAYKEFQRKERNRSKSPANMGQQSRIRSFLSWDMSSGTTSFLKERKERDYSSSNNRNYSNRNGYRSRGGAPVMPTSGESVVFRRTHSTGDSAAARTLKAIMAKKLSDRKLSLKEETSTAETTTIGTDQASHSGRAFRSELALEEEEQSDEQRATAPVPTTINISNDDHHKEDEVGSENQIDKPSKPSPAKSGGPLFDTTLPIAAPLIPLFDTGTVETSEKPVADKQKPLFDTNVTGQTPSANKPKLFDIPKPLFDTAIPNQGPVADKPKPLFNTDLSSQAPVDNKPKPLFGIPSAAGPLSQAPIDNKPKPLFGIPSAAGPLTATDKAKPLFDTNVEGHPPVASKGNALFSIPSATGKPKSLFGTVVEGQAPAASKVKPLFGAGSESESEVVQPLLLSRSSSAGRPRAVERPKTLLRQVSETQAPGAVKPKPLFDLVSTKQPPKPLFDLTAADSSKAAKPQPVQPSKEEQPAKTADTPVAPRKKKALVIEDTVVVRKTLSRALQKRGYEVSQANDGLEGLHALKETVFDITLCDFLMPNMDGLDCVQQYRQWEKENRDFQQYIVGISAHVSQNDVEKGLEIGMNGFRPKPITMKTLQELDESRAMAKVRAKLDTMCMASPGKLNAPADKVVTGQRSDVRDAASEVAPQRKSCLMATERAKGETREAARKMSADGWAVTVVENGSSALEQLKSRNWGAVVLDDHLPYLSGNQCVEEFRAWESQNRVNRQDNLFIVCTDVVLANPETSMLPPAGFDGAMDSQVNWKSLQNLIGKQESRRSTRGGLSIVTR